MIKNKRIEQKRMAIKVPLPNGANATTAEPSDSSDTKIRLKSYIDN
jgi:hypothetical protein